VAVSLLGLVGLPLVFGGAPDSTHAIVWLGLATVAGVCLLVAAVLLVNPLAGALMHAPVRGLEPHVIRRASVDVARLTAVVVCVVLLQAMLRRPVISAFGANAEPFAVEASIGIVGLVVLLMALLWLHYAARLLIENMAETALDAGLSTTSTESAAPVATIRRPVTRSGATERGRQDATFVGPLKGVGGGATLTRQDATIVGPLKGVGGEATLTRQDVTIVGPLNGAGDEATLVRQDATLVRPLNGAGDEAGLPSSELRPSAESS
jgi:hypothetical protein